MNLIDKETRLKMSSPIRYNFQYDTLHTVTRTLPRNRNAGEDDQGGGSKGWG